MLLFVPVVLLEAESNDQMGTITVSFMLVYNVYVCVLYLIGVRMCYLLLPLEFKHVQIWKHKQK